MAKKRMPISIRFTLRSPKKNQGYSNPHPLQVWITVNRKRIHYGAVWPVRTGEKLLVNPSDWRVDRQDSKRRDDPVNAMIPALKAHIMKVFRAQTIIGPPTIDSVYYELQNGITPPYTSRTGWETKSEPEAEKSGRITEESSLVEVYTSRIIEKRLQYGPTLTKKQKVEIGRWERGLFLLQEWERQKKKPVPPCYRITLSWLRDFHAWMQTQKSDKQAKPISGPMASRYIGKIGQVLQWMVDDELLLHNAVKKTSWERYNDKEIHFLEPEHVTRLFSIRWKRTKGVVLWWFLLMCCTGLDYPDAVAYARYRGSLERVGPAGLKLIGRRMKPPHEEFDVPLLDEVEWLFAMHPHGPIAVAGGTINRYTDQIEQILDIDWRITAKTARKTFGCLMIINGYLISEVSRMLGHRRISTTEQHYAKFIGTGVDRARKRVGKTSLL